MVNDSSLAGGAMQFGFDLESQKGVMVLLAAVRASEISTADKNELRDLILQYTNGGKDHSVRITIQQKVLAFGIQPIGGVSAAAPVTPHAFGTSRPLPSFSVPTAPVSPLPPTPPPTASVSMPVAPPVVTPPPVMSPPPPPIAAPVVEQPVVPPPAAAPLPPVEPVPVSVATPVVTVVPEPAPVADMPVAAAVPPPASYDADRAMQRIREIKSLVNDKVGNPVNLVNIDNAVGREYMAALLDAMKKLGNGTSAISAMQRLETAFVAVEETLKNHTVHTASEAVTEPLPPPSQPITPIVQESGFADVAPESNLIPEPVADETQTFSVAESPVSPEANFVSGPVGYAAANVSSEPVAEIPSAWGPATDTLTQPSSRTVQSNTARVSSLADTKDKLRSPDELLSPADIESSSVSGDALFTKEVDDGLQQLLAEWSLFKKSGLFGTGPKGREHPLFKKIASLQIPLLLAGRFEGATQEIKQSITDYMNGWRYEQGIVYEQGETFEHYLRRVIRHILDLQKKKLSS